MKINTIKMIMLGGLPPVAAGADFLSSAIILLFHRINLGVIVKLGQMMELQDKTNA